MFQMAGKYMIKLILRIGVKYVLHNQIYVILRNLNHPPVFNWLNISYVPKPNFPTDQHKKYACS